MSRDAQSIHALTSRVARELREAGYSHVQMDMAADSDNRHSFDLIAFATREDGTFGPLVCVEIKTSNSELGRATAKELLISAHMKLGTTKNYLVVKDEIFQLSHDLTQFVKVQNFAKAPTSDAEVKDLDIAVRLLESYSLNNPGEFHNNFTTGAMLRPIFDSALDAKGFVYLPESNLKFQNLLFTKAWFKLLETRSSKYAGESFTPQKINKVLAAIIGNLSADSIVIDPFSGYGSTLVSIAENQTESTNCNYISVEINTNTSKVSQKIFEILKIDANAIIGDSFQIDIPKADCIVTIPPFGMRLQIPFQTPFGEVIEGDVAAIALIAMNLKPGGRAVAVVPRGWAFKLGQSSKLRTWLATNFHVKALVNLPAVLPTTGIPLMLVVIENKAPGSTIVAELSEDWAEHFLPSTELLSLLTEEVN